MITIFKTNVKGEDEAEVIINHLLISYPNFEINFDLEDCDSILQVKGERYRDVEIVSSLNIFRYTC